MSKKPPRSALREESRLWHDAEQHQIKMGCYSCPWLKTCGGLAVQEALLDCLGLCCLDTANCTRTCPKNAGFADRTLEIDGFGLLNVPVAPQLAEPTLPSLIPMFMHRGNRARPITHGAIALSLYEMFSRGTPTLKFSTRDDLDRAFLIAPGAALVLSGTAEDNPLERWWQMGSSARREAARAISSLRPELVTTPNYSLFCSRVRFDDLSAMKRIAITAEEFASAGVATGLHVNARTDRDYERWAEFLRHQPAITHIAAEFATGAGRANRIAWHVDRLVRLPEEVGRPLKLVVRGGTEFLPMLLPKFERLHFLETSVFMKSMNRQAAIVQSDGAIGWETRPTPKHLPLDDIVEHNLGVIAASFAARTAR